MQYYRSEIKTGIMAITCIILLMLATFYIGGATMFGTTYSLNVTYKNVGGLELDAPVQYAGLEVGSIKKIRVMDKTEKENFPNCTVVVTIQLDKSVKVKKDSKIAIKTMGFMGLKYLDITPGSDNAETISANSTVLGQTSQDMNDLMDSVAEIVNEIKPKTGSIVAGIDNLIGENGSLQTTIVDLHKLVNDTDEVIVVNKEDIRKMIANLADTSNYLKQFAEDIKSNPWKLLIKTSEKKKAKEPMPDKNDLDTFEKQKKQSEHKSFSSPSARKKNQS
jgi:phospholipid/cholesterol/gamma-HCH transport system substrate-binding protein